MSRNILDYIQDDDIEYEKALLKDPYDLQGWLDYIDHKQSSEGGKNLQPTLAILNRAINTLPRSYKLWMMYLTIRIELLNGLKIRSKPEVNDIIRLFERCLISLGKFPQVWIKFYEFLLDNLKFVDLSYVRKQFDLGLRELSIVQHIQVWGLYLRFADFVGGRTLFWVYYRYCEFKISLDDYSFRIDDININDVTENKIENVEFETILEKLTDTISSLSQLKQLDSVYERLLSDPKLLIKLSRPELEFYVQYFDTLISLSTSGNLEGGISNLDSRIISFTEKATSKFPDQMGRFRVKLANYWIKRKDFFRVINAFETGIEKCVTLKDFTLIFDAYSEFEFSRVSKLSDKLDMLEESGAKTDELSNEVTTLLARYEKLLNRRSFLVNDVLLRQNANNVQEWLNRVELFDPDSELEKILECYVTAIKTINPQKVPTETGSLLLSKLWIQYANIYDQHGDTSTARQIYNTAIKVPFREIDDLINIWISWTEMELNHDDFEHALTIIKQSVEVPKQTKQMQRIDYKDTELAPQMRIHKSIKLWSMYLDLVESSGDLAETIKVYDQVLDLKIATPLTVLNYCSLLEENEHYEECFKVFERGIQAFKYPTVFELWSAYLNKLTTYQTKLKINLERIRELFEESVVGCPDEFKKSIFIAYANFEELKGSKLRSLKVYRMALDSISNNVDRLELYKILILKSTEIKNLESTREVYQDAIEHLPVRTHGFIEFIIMGFARTELMLGELVRSREVLKYGAELIMKASKLSKDRDLMWDSWKRFELENGDEETYKEMLRYKRYLENIYNLDPELPAGKKEVPQGFVASSEGPKVTTYTIGVTSKEDNGKDAESEGVANDDQIDLDLDDL